jgi:hypothetical protein
MWDITQCSPLKISQTFRMNMSPPSSAEVACVRGGFLHGLIFDPEDGGDVTSKRRLTFSELHGLISQMIVLPRAEQALLV